MFKFLLMYRAACVASVPPKEWPVKKILELGYAYKRSVNDLIMSLAIDEKAL